MTNEEIFTFDHVQKIFRDKKLFKIALLSSLVVSILTFIFASAFNLSLYTSSLKVMTPWFDIREIYLLESLAKQNLSAEIKKTSSKSRASMSLYPNLRAVTKTGIVIFNIKSFISSALSKKELDEKFMQHFDAFLEDSFYKINLISIRNYFENMNYFKDYFSGTNMEYQSFYKNLEGLELIDKNPKNISTAVNNIIKSGASTKNEIIQSAEELPKRQQEIVKGLITFMGTWQDHILKVYTGSAHHTSKFRLYFSLFTGFSLFLFLYGLAFIKALVFSEE